MELINNRKYRPTAILERHVQHYFLFEKQASTADWYELVTPDGFVEMIFNLQAPLMRKERDGTVHKQSDSYLVSRFTQPYFLNNSGRVMILGVRFYPWAISTFIDCSVSEVRDKSIALEHIMGNKVKSIHDRLSSISNPRKAIEVIEQFLIAEMLGMDRTEKIVADFSKKIFLSSGKVEITEVAKGYGLTQRRLQQIFAQHLGISPVLLKRLVRFQHALRIVNAAKASTSETLSLTRLSYHSGYFDQSHFIRDFKYFSDIIPKQYLKGNFQLNEIITDTMSYGA